MEKKTAYERTQMDVVVFDKEDVIATSGGASTCECHSTVHVSVCTSDNTSSCLSDNPCGMNISIRGFGQTC